MVDSNLAFISLILLFPISIFIFLFIIIRPRGIKIPIKGRHVFITGGSSGIGLSLAHRAAAEGAARVSILARSKSKLEDARNEIQLATGIDVTVYSVDVRDFDAVKKAIEDAGPIDVLVCNQGFAKPEEFENQEMQDIKFMIDVNLMGTIHLIKAALPGMKNRKDGIPASISITSSQVGQVGIYGYAGYAASKFGLRGFAESLQQEIIMDNIHVSLIFPPDTETPGFIEENKTKPELTSILSSSSGGMNADEVAKKALDGIKSGSFVVSCNFEGFLLALATAGLSPQRSSLIAFVEVFSASILRIVALCFQWNWYSSIEKWQKTQKKQ
ncbi:3-dehydrosphinganine reductase TSC10A-like [Impatiens glandulifera]|uniref:3-dehydrosphinganine reductase TSC10A-like n=1 Tax=Impatiens glandulifera TaxID=253017 RepID=UPI001FB0A6B9|nr:3-dehydrosphinganine reductase TSC10A-like [Impatiens glandulifera]